VHAPVPAPVAAASCYPIAHPHTIGYGLGYLVGWLLIISPIALLAWLNLAHYDPLNDAVVWEERRGYLLRQVRLCNS
jgi:hypothetical protein